MKSVSFLLLIWFVETVHSVQPTGCSYDSLYSKTGVYTCEFGSYTPPLTYSGFSSPLPQRLKITKLTGTFPSSGSAFSGFSSFNSASFDVNYPAILELECASSGTLTLTTGTFTDMDYLQEVLIRHCKIASLTSGMLSNFGTLNSLRFEGGSIASYSADYLNGLTIEPMTTTPEPKGEFVIKDCSITPSTIKAGAFDVLTTAKTIMLENAGITTVDQTAFSLVASLTHVSLADNSFTLLEDDTFQNLSSLSYVNLDGIAYNCTCSTLGILTFASQNSVDLTGPVCDSPTGYQNKRATKFYSDSCVTPPSCSDVAIGSLCITIIDIVGVGVSFITLVISAIAMAVICHTRRQLMTATSNVEMTKSKSWTRLRESIQLSKLPMKVEDLSDNTKVKKTKSTL